MSNGNVACTECGSPVDPRRDYREVTGWERVRDAGGANAIALRHETGRWRCRTCHDSAKHGGTPSMF